MSEYYAKLYRENFIPSDHVKFLHKLKADGFEPKVIYDIGSCVLNWEKEAKAVWPNAEIILFEANPLCEFLYKSHRYHIGVLSDTDEKLVKFYSSEESIGGNSYYKEIGHPASHHLFTEKEATFRIASTLDTIVAENEFPMPDLIKMDVQGAELDICKGAINTLAHTTKLILELPHDGVAYNEGAPTGRETIKWVTSQGFECTDPLFCSNGQYDGDYCFTRKNNKS